jgi:beta-glucosidase
MSRAGRWNSRILSVLVVSLLFALFVPFSTGQTKRLTSAAVEKRVDDLLSKMTLEQKIKLIGGTHTFYTQAIPRVGIPALRMSDGPLGVHDYGPTTAYAAPIALAASWDTELAKRVGISMGSDARARGVNFILAPGMNIYRAPMNGRNFEYLGEDPYLASRMAVNLIEGIQSQDVIATAKHFAANNEEIGRMDHSSDVDERTLREIYLPAFEAAVREAHVGALMDAYNLVNGTYMTENKHLNIEIAKKEWGFDGIIMSDWGATHDGIAAANGGLDLEMPSGAHMNAETLIPAIQKGLVTEATIDDKVRRILRKAIQFGFFDRSQTELSIPLYSQAGRKIALEEARSGMVLLKNENHLLPLDKNKIKTIAVLGPDAYPAVVGGGGSSLTQPFNAVSYLEGISNYLGPSKHVLSVTELPDVGGIAKATEFHTSPGGPIGLAAEYFNNEDLQGPPALTRTDEHIDFDWGENGYAPKAPAYHFSARWTGYFIPEKEDYYTFYVSTDDGARLFIDGRKVIDDWQRHGETLNTYAQHLEAGRAYKVELEYFQNLGGAIARFGVASATQPLYAETREVARKADVVIVCVGFSPATEGEGSDRTFRLPGGQDALIEQLAAINKNVVVVFTAGGNVDMTGWIDKVPALLHAWYPGEEGGMALAQILFGEYDPSGKLPVSFERRWEDSAAYGNFTPKPGTKDIEYKEGIFLGYRHFDRSKVKPLFPFGFGLSYTTFTYSNLVITPASGDVSAPITVSFDIKNTGSREGAEVAEVYVGEEHPSVPRPLKELKGFAKVNLRPGESKRVSVSLNRRAFSFYDMNKHDWTADPGEFDILVGSSSEKIELQGKFRIAAN